MSRTDLERLDAIVEAAARALFATHGLTLGARSADVAAAHGDHNVAGSIGFTSAEIRGAVLLTARRDVLARAWPTELRHRVPSDRDVCDWTGELVNQLLGRVKNALVPFGLVIEQSTPTVVAGRHLHRVPTSTNVSRRYLFDVGANSIAIYFDAILADGFSLSVREGEPAQAVVEGDVQLF